MKKGIARLLGTLKQEDKETITLTANNIQSFLAFIKDNVLLFVDFFSIEAIAPISGIFKKYLLSRWEGHAD